MLIRPRAFEREKMIAAARPSRSNGAPGGCALPSQNPVECIASAKSLGIGASNVLHSAVRGWQKPSFQACSIWRGILPVNFGA
jgi:hypothetical protein